MKKLAALLLCTIGLTACGGNEKQVVYVDSETGKPLDASSINLITPIPHLDVGVVCLGGILYYRDESYRRSALTPVLVPSTTVSVPASIKLEQVHIGDRPHDLKIKYLKDTELTYANLVGVRCP